MLMLIATTGACELDPCYAAVAMLCGVKSWLALSHHELSLDAMSHCALQT